MTQRRNTETPPDFTSVHVNSNLFQTFTTSFNRAACQWVPLRIKWDRNTHSRKTRFLRDVARQTREIPSSLRAPCQFGRFDAAVSCLSAQLTNSNERKRMADAHQKC